MAEDSDSAVAAEPPRLLPGALIKREKIRRLPLDSAFALPWSMVAIRSDGSKNPPVVFPPVNHENLLVSTDPSPTPNQIPHIHTDVNRIPFTDSDTDSETVSTSTFSPSDSSPPPCFPLFPVPARRFDSWTEVFHSKLIVLGRLLYSGLTSSRGVFVTFRSAAFTAVLIAFLYFRWRRRMRAAGESRTWLAGVIQERDEKIDRLLEQISQMNQLLLKLGSNPSG